jgi:hypothetical protein
MEWSGGLRRTARFQVGRYVRANEFRTRPNDGLRNMGHQMGHDSADASYFSDDFRRRGFCSANRGREVNLPARKVICLYNSRQFEQSNQAEVLAAEKVKTKRPAAIDDLSPIQIRDCGRSIVLYPPICLRKHRSEGECRIFQTYCRKFGRQFGTLNSHVKK